VEVVGLGTETMKSPTLAESEAGGFQSYIYVLMMHFTTK
jgi:hypothetical protein